MSTLSPCPEHYDCAACSNYASELIALPDPNVISRAEHLKALESLRERAAEAAQKPTGHWSIGRNRRPYWDGNQAAAEIRALSLEEK